MQEPYSEGLAIHTDPESCVAPREGCDEALTGAHAGWVLSHVIVEPVRSADALENVGRQYRVDCYRKINSNSAWSETPRMHGNSAHGNWEILFLACINGSQARIENLLGVSQ